MKKRLLSLILAFVMVLGMVPATAFAAEGETGAVSSESAGEMTADTMEGGAFGDGSDEVIGGEDSGEGSEAETPEPAVFASGYCGEQDENGDYGKNVRWILTDDGVLTISGSGAMADYAKWGPWFGAEVEVTSVVVEKGVTTIGSRAFFYCMEMTSVILPEGLTAIGEYAFGMCSSLTDIAIPETVTTIGASAFNCCEGLTRIRIPAGVTTIGEDAFSYCTGLTAITVEADNTSYSSDSYGVLFNKAQTELIRYPAGSTCASYDIPAGVTQIGVSAFEDCSGLAEINIPASVTSLGDFAFYYCPALEQVEFQGNTPAIGNYAFYGCTALAQIVFQGDASTVGQLVFSNVSAKATCYYPAGNKTWTDAVMQDYSDGATLTWVAVEMGGGEVPEIPGGEEIGGEEGDPTSGTYGDNLTWAFADGVLTISGKGDMADANGDQPWSSYLGQITSVVVSEGVTAVGASAFYQLKNLTSVTLADSVTAVGRGAFYHCTALKSVDLGGVTSIGDEAFSGCAALPEITIPGDGTAIGKLAFFGCIALKTIEFEGSPAAPTPVYAAGEMPFQGVSADAWYTAGKGWWDTNCAALGNCLTWNVRGTNGDLTWTLVDGVLTVSGEGALEDFDPYVPGYSSEVTRVVIEDGVTAIGDWVFNGWRAMTSVRIPDSVTSIGNASFTTCESLTGVVIPEGVTSIGASAFAYCSDLENILFLGAAPEFGADVFSLVKPSAYYYCYDETWTEDVTDGTKGAYGPNSQLSWTGVYDMGTCGESLYWIVREMYEYENNEICGYYHVMDICGSGVMDDYDEAPWCGYSESLRTVNLPEGLTHIGTGAFWYMHALSEVTIPASVTSMGDGAFAACAGLQKFEVRAGNAAFYTDEYGVLFDSENRLVQFPLGSRLRVYAIPDGTTAVGVGAFSGGFFLNHVTVPAGVTCVEEGAFAYSEITRFKFLGDMPEMEEYSFADLSCVWYYPEDKEAWTAAAATEDAKLAVLEQCNAERITWVGTDDNTAPVLSNAYAKTMTEGNILWQTNNVTWTLQSVLGSYENGSAPVFLYWTCTESDAEYEILCGEDVYSEPENGDFGICSFTIPEDDVDQSTHTVVAYDGSGNVTCLTVRVETNDVTAPTVKNLTGTFGTDGAALTWTNEAQDIGPILIFVDADGDSMLDLDTDAVVNSYCAEVLEDGAWRVSIDLDDCESAGLKAGDKLSVLLSDGAWNMAVYSAALAGGSDSEKPGVELTAAPATAGGTEAGTVTVSLAATDNVGVREVVLTYTCAGVEKTLKTWDISDEDQTEWSGSYSWDVSGLTSGEYTLTVTAADAAGNKKSTTAAVTVDNAAPAVGSLTYAVAGETVTLSWTGQADDLNAVTVCRAYRDPVISSEWTPYEALTGTVGTAFVDDAAKPDGEYIYYVKLTDKLGNVNTSSTVRVMVDTVAPELNVYEAPKDGSRVWGDISFGVSAVDVHSQTASLTMNWVCGEQSGSQPLTGGTCTIDTSSLAEGETLTVTFTAVDNAGNETEPVTLTYSVDNYPEAPTNLTAKVEGEGILLSWKASKPEDNVEKYVLLRAEVDAAGVVGTYEVVDTNIGKVTLGSVIGAVVADAVKAELQAILTGQSGVTVRDLLDNYSLTDAAKAALEAIQCDYLDTGAEFGVTYSYKLAAQGCSGLIAESQPTQAVTFEDKTAPVVNTFELDTPEAVYGGTKDVITFRIKATDNAGVDHLELSWTINGEKTTETFNTPERSYGLDVSAFPSGEHVISLVAVDKFGNASDAKTVTVTVDNTAPAEPANLRVVDSYECVQLRWDGDTALRDEGGSYRIERDGVSVGTCPGNMIGFNDPVTDYSEHTYRVVALDAVGNETASETVTAKKLVDTENPVVFDVWPREGMTICHDDTVQVSAVDNWKVVKIEAGYALAGGEIVWFDPVVTNSPNPVVSFPWDVSELSGAATLYFKITDAAGRTVQRTETVNIMAYAVPEAPAGLTAAAGFKSTTLNWSEGDTTLLKQFKVYQVVDGSEVLLANLRNNNYTVTGLSAETTLRVYAEDIYGAISEKAEITLTPVLTETVAPVAVIQPAQLTGVVGSPVKLYGGNSTDNDAIASYEWTFHDGKTVEAVTTEKTYSAAGTYEVTLTVTDNSSNSASVTGTVTIYDVTGEDATHTVLTVTVNDSVTVGTPLLENVTVTVTNDDGFETSALTDNKGKAVLVVPQGECTLTAIKKGYAGAVRKIEVTSDEQGCAYQLLSLACGGVSTLSGTLTAERMTYEEIKAAGIDVTNPANNHVVKQEFALRFVATPELAFDIPVTNYVNASGHCVGGVGLGWGTYVREDDHYTPVIGTPGVAEIVEDSVTVGIFPVGKSYYLVIYGETHWLKEMFHVELILVNNSYEEDVKDCIATLNLPEGLSLAAMLDYGQCARVSVGDIDRAAVDPETGTTEFDQAQVSWYVRGDVMGEYYLTADVTGNFVNDNNQKTPINMTFETTESIKVYAGSALHLTVTAQDTAYSEQEYRVQFKLENVSDIDLYNLSFGLTGAEQYSCIVWSDGTETRFEDLDKEDFGDKMTFRVPVLKPGQCITINFVTTCLFEADLASALVDKVTFGTMEIAFKLTDVFVTTLEGSTTEIPTDVILEPVPKATFTEWLWGEIKDAVKDGIKDAALQAFDALFFGGVPVTQYGVKVFEVGSDLLEDTKANSKAVVAISDGAYFLDSDNVIHTSGGAVVDPAALYSLRRNAGGVAVYTDAEDYTISDDGKTMTINGEGNVYLLRTGDTGDVEPEVHVTTEYLVTNPDYDPNTDPESEKYLEKTFTQILKEDVKVDENGDVVTDDEGNPVLQDYSADLITAADVVLLAPTVNTVEIPAEGTVSVTFPHFMTDGAGTVATAAQNVSWTLTDAAGEAVTAGMDLADGVLTVNSLAQPGVYTVTLSINGTETSVSQSITLTQKAVLPGNEPIGKTGLVYTGTAQELVSAGISASGTMQYALGTDSTAIPAESAWSVHVPKAVNAGTYHVWYRVLADGDSGGVGATYAGGVTIASKDVSSAVITLGDALTYTGQERTQTVASVVVDGKTLVAGTDYTVTGNTAVDVGGEDYTLTVTGTGNYTGTATEVWNLAKADQTAPNAPERSAVTQDSITLTAVAGGQGAVEYKCGDGLWQTSPEFTGLTAATRYTFAVRYTGDGNYNEAVSASADFYTAAATPGAGEGYAVDYVGETVTVTDGYEVYTAVVDGAPVNSGTLVTPGITLYIRVAANGEIPASAWTELTIPARPAAPSELQGIHETIDGKNDGRITGITTAMEYSSDSICWTGCTAEAVTDLADGTYQVRVKAVDGVSFAGAHAYVVISAGRKIGVFFEENGGTAVADWTGLSYNAQVTLPAAVRTGYTFDGWAAEANGAVVYMAQTDVTVTADMTLYAKWTPITYTVKFEANGGSGTMEELTLTYDAAQKLAGNAFTRSGYTFAGWNTAADGSGTGYSNGRNVVNLADTQDAVVTLYARWNAIYYPPSGGSTSGGTTAGGTTGDTTSTTTKNEDGSTTTTETDKKTGTVTETTTKTETETGEDGSSVTTDTKVETTTTADGVVTTKTETATKTESADGSSTTVTESVVEEKVETEAGTLESKTTETTVETTDKDGNTVTETVKVEETVEKTEDTTTTTTTTTTEAKTETVEVKEEIVVKEDGTTETKTTSTTTAELADGTTAASTTDERGKTEAQVVISEKAAENAAEAGEAVALPIPAVTTSAESDKASVVEVSIDSAEKTKVEIPVADATPGTVVVVVNEDGTEDVVKKAVQSEAGLIVKLEGSATVKIVENSMEFVDVDEGTWYAESVDFVSSRELFNGVGNGRFAPEENTTRGMLVTVLHRMEDEMKHSYSGSYLDVEEDEWYTDAVHWAADHSIVEGYGDGYFGTHDSITREQMVTLVYRYLTWMGVDTSARGDLSGFTDCENVSDWAVEALRWSVGAGVINGIGDNRIAPEGHATRAQIAVFMQRITNLMF